MGVTLPLPLQVGADGMAGMEFQAEAGMGMPIAPVVIPGVIVGFPFRRSPPTTRPLPVILRFTPPFANNALLPPQLSKMLPPVVLTLALPLNSMVWLQPLALSVATIAAPLNMEPVAPVCPRAL